MIFRHLISIGSICALLSCSAPNHLGNPLTLPVRGLASALENAAYDRRRARVKAWIVEHEMVLRDEGFSGPVAQDLLGQIPPQNREQAREDLREAAEFADFSERATVIIMVLGS